MCSTSCFDARILGLLCYSQFIPGYKICYSESLLHYGFFFPILTQGHAYLFLFIYFKNILFIFRERGREEKREGQKHQLIVALHVPYCGPGPQPRRVL